jgi:exodeoxyribonuclease III
MRIVTWNVNGIRALIKKGAFDWLIQNNPDVFCLQETKAHPDQIPEDIRHLNGYQTFFDHSKLKKGYSGVAIYTKKKPIKDKDFFNMSPDATDQEGRFYQVEYEDFILINCYFPNGGGKPERLSYKLAFYDAFTSYIKDILKQGKELIVCGDFNIVHNEIDSARFKENQGNIGFLPEERQKLDNFLDIGLVDVYRHFYPDVKDKFTWWDMKSFARDRNIGWRIDTFFASKDVLRKIKDIEIYDDVLGSDHCPVSISIE